MTIRNTLERVTTQQRDKKMKNTTRLKLTKANETEKEMLAKDITVISKALKINHVQKIIYKNEAFYTVSSSMPSDESLKNSIKTKYLLSKEVKEKLFKTNENDTRFVSVLASLNPARIKGQMCSYLYDFHNANKGQPLRTLYYIKNNEVKRYSTSIALDEVPSAIQSLWDRTVSGQKARERRMQREVDSNVRRIYGDVLGTKVGGVYTESGLFLRAYQEKLNRILQTSKKPMTKEKHFGVELEFIMPLENKKNIENLLRESEYRNYFCLGKDGSVYSDDEHEGAELRICVPESKSEECINFVSKVLMSNGANVDKTCGLHVHLDARNFDAETIFNNLLGQQAALFQLVPKSRRDNQYCRHTAKKDFNLRGRGDRYKAINSLSFVKYQTIEVRLHSGSVEATKINCWIKLLNAIAYNTEAITRSRTVKTMLDKINLSDDVKAYLLGRAEKFKTHGAVVVSDDENNEDEAA
jgi:hypothetical protein